MFDYLSVTIFAFVLIIITYKVLYIICGNLLGHGVRDFVFGAIIYRLLMFPFHILGIIIRSLQRR